MIRITSKQDGFRRCGTAHPKEATEYADDRFTPGELEILSNEPMLVVDLSQYGGPGTGKVAKPLKAAELIDLIGKAETVEAVDELLGDDTRTTVLAAAIFRKAELQPTE